MKDSCVRQPSDLPDTVGSNFFLEWGNSLSLKKEIIYVSLSNNVDLKKKREELMACSTNIYTV